MKVHIIDYDYPSQWILGKISTRLCDQLTEQGIVASIGPTPNYKADVNHHVWYLQFAGKKSNLDTLMVTHVDSKDKIKTLLNFLKVADGAVFFSEQTRNMLSLVGAEKEKLTVISPAQDGIIKPRKIVIGITSNAYADNRKREDILESLAERVDLTSFRFEIMGKGWQPFVSKLEKNGVEVRLQSEFNYSAYTKLIQRLDFYLYTGLDEGSMGYLDAVAAAVKTIVTPQGFHLDLSVAIDHPFETEDDLILIFKKIAKDRKVRVDSVLPLTWTTYAKSHVAFWNRLLNRKDSAHE